MGEPPRARFQLRSYLVHIHEIWEFVRGRRPSIPRSPPVPPPVVDWEEEYTPRVQTDAESDESIRSREERSVKIAFGVYIAFMAAVILSFLGWAYMNGRREVTTLASWKLVTDAGVTEIQLEAVDYPQFATESVNSDKLEQHLKRTRPDFVKVRMTVYGFDQLQWKGQIYEVDGIDVSDLPGFLTAFCGSNLQRAFSTDI